MSAFKKAGFPTQKTEYDYSQLETEAMDMIDLQSELARLRLDDEIDKWTAETLRLRSIIEGLEKLLEVAKCPVCDG